LAFYYNTWVIALGVGGLSLAAYYSAKILLPGSNLYQYVLSAVLGIFMAQYIYQMHGLFEMHFLAFIGSAILITYQNWKLQIPLMLVVVLHHALFGYLQDAGYGKIYFTQLETFELTTFLIHILLAAIIFFICGLWAYQLNKYSERQIMQSLEMEKLQKEALEAVNLQKEQLERHVAVLDKAVAQGKFEVASDVMHDIGNAVVGFGSYLTQVKGLQDPKGPGILENLAEFFKKEQSAMSAAIGEEKAGAIVDLLKGLVEAQKSKQAEIARSITEQIGIVGNIQDILHIQRRHIEGHQSSERKGVNLRNIINDTLAMLFASLDKLAIAVSVDIPADLPTFKGDRTRLMQVMLSVLNNSIEAIVIQGQDKAISLRATLEAGLLALEVEDTGNGFDPDTARRLFQRGFTTKPTGAGQSLCSCREIMESHSGSMAITSSGPGRGALTSIKFKIP
jgi:two-component system sensor histidine kinase/response regulator